MSREVRAIQVAIACAAVGAASKLTAGVITGSMTTISSAVDSLGDLIVSLANLFVVRFAARAPDEGHNYGHAKIEGLGAMFEGGFIFAAGGFIIYEANHRAMVGEISHDSRLGIVVMLPVLAMTIGTVLYLRRVAAVTGSLVIKADATHYATDVYVNLGVLVALALVWVTGEPLCDTAISIAIALYMLWSSGRIVREGFDVVMDHSLDRETVSQLRAVLAACSAIESFHDFKTRTGRTPYVDFHVVVRPEMTAREVHEVYVSLRDQVRAIAGATTVVLMHADPATR